MPESQVKELMNQQRKPTGIDLVNTNRRREKIFGKGLVIKSTEGKGTIVSITIPLKTSSLFR